MMEEEIYKLIFKLWCNINISSAVTKEQKVIEILEMSIEFMEGLCKIQNPDWQPNDETKTVKQAIFDLKASCKSRFVPGGVPIKHNDETQESANPAVVYNQEVNEHLKKISDGIISDYIDHIEQDTKCRIELNKKWQKTVDDLELSKRHRNINTDQNFQEWFLLREHIPALNNIEHVEGIDDSFPKSQSLTLSRCGHLTTGWLFFVTHQRKMMWYLPEWDPMYFEWNEFSFWKYYKK